MLLNDRAGFDLAVRVRREGAPLGEIFQFMSGLYFRGKLAYASTFAAPPPGLPGALVIAAGRGLIAPETRVTIEELRQMGAVPVDAADERYRVPLERHARMLNESAGPNCMFILLGSVATLKYLEPLAAVFGDRLLFPLDFAGRGDMSRGGLMLRCARTGVELSYAPVGHTPRHGRRPDRLPSRSDSSGAMPRAHAPRNRTEPG